jgi:hypothetical protein
MKASAQYNDFKGTSAADISDHEKLEGVLDRLGVDTSRYKAVGARFFSGTNGFFSGSILAEDQQKSSDGESHVVEISVELDRAAFFDMFKRLDVVLVSRFASLENVDVRNTINLDEAAAQ